jgi:hypothetical protein
VAQHALEMKAYAGAKAAWDGYQQSAVLHDAAEKAQQGGGDLAAAAQTFAAQVDSVGGGTGGGRGRGFGRGGGGGAPPNFRALNGSMLRELDLLDTGDMVPTPAQVAAFAGSCSDLRTAAAHWRTVIGKDLAAFNAALSRAGQTPVAVPPGITAPGC